MRNIIFLCLLSGFAGGLVAVMWFAGPAVEPQSIAQDTPTVSTPSVHNAPAINTSMTMQSPQGTVDMQPAVNLQNLTPDEQINVSVYQNVNRSVVNINTKGYEGVLLFAVASEGEGSGMVLDRQGNILTNFHVVDGAEQIQVTLSDGSNYPAQVVGVDPDTDIAVLKINAPQDLLYPVALGSSSNLLVGLRVFAIGNPFGLERTMATGIISSLNRTLPARRTQRTIKSIIQIDAAINPGNSGGPLLNSQSQLIGMCTAIASKSGDSAGVGFAIPVNTIKRIVPQLIQNGRVVRPESGIGRVMLIDRGLRVLTVIPGGPAAKAGLQGAKVERQKVRQGPFTIEQPVVNLAVADIITAVDGKPIHTGDEFLDIIESKRPGDQIVLTVIRGGQQVQVPMRLEAAK